MELTAAVTPSSPSGCLTVRRGAGDDTAGVAQTCSRPQLDMGLAVPMVWPIVLQVCWPVGGFQDGPQEGPHSHHPPTTHPPTRLVLVGEIRGFGWLCGRVVQSGPTRCTLDKQHCISPHRAQSFFEAAVTGQIPVGTDTLYGCLVVHIKGHWRLYIYIYTACCYHRLDPQLHQHLLAGTS